ncbi:Protein FAR1-RELATED SEQUENCE 5 [Rhynchospora pubera]|uniref:Protein FAR1-RELATED SEQUENCE 5 n=1 Tax=Rhynchospora pubera TaxID=906938 RepID=A0AAV8CW09_9POAL|nr:Protein FAR1-RELATED SEQUENCE 5 [Rhynchospora pubera]
MDIHLAETSGIRPRETHELLSRQAGGVRSIGYTINDLNNCLRDKRKQAMEYGAAVAITKYFEKRTSENPFFQHFEDITENQEITNILWMDGKMIAAYVRFGDVVIFDTTFGTNKEKWALGTFVGFNHFREIVIFGASLICNSTIISFEWAFTKFLEAHSGKRPITIFTDQESAIGIALEQVMPDTKHGLCVWHINKNCQQKIMCYQKKGIDISGEFSKCMFKYEDEDEFEKVIKELESKLDEKDKGWIDFMYGCREKWAYCFMKNAYTLGIRSTQASESINSNLKNYLNCKLDVNRFLEQFERVLDAKREKEITSEYDMRRIVPRVRLHVPILCEAGELYTPKILELFQKEFELSGSTYIEAVDGYTYTIGMCNINNKECSNKSRQVIWNRDDQSIVCSCKKFERVGILCCHALKVLDREDVKFIPPRYILKRWTQNAKDDTIVDREGRVVIEDAMLEVRNRNAQLIREILPTCGKAAHDEEKTQFFLNVLRSARERYEERYENSSKRANDGLEDSSHSQPENSLRLKKKDGDKHSKRKKAWNENLSRRKKGNGRCISNSQPSLRSGINLSQDISEHFGCHDNLEDIHHLQIIED